jgi:hypothetical protein
MNMTAPDEVVFRLDAVVRRSPARHYVVVDDKLRMLAAMKAALGSRLTTVFPRQGHYALDPKNVTAYPPADKTVQRIGERANGDLPVVPGLVEAGPAE